MQWRISLEDSWGRSHDLGEVECGGDQIETEAEKKADRFIDRHRLGCVRVVATTICSCKCDKEASNEN